eukprot:g13124.t1
MYDPAFLSGWYPDYEHNETLVLAIIELFAKSSVITATDPLLIPQAQLFAKSKSRAILACAINGLALRYTTQSLRDDPELVGVAVRADWRALRYASRRLRSTDRDLARLAISQCGWALKYCSGPLRDDLELACQAVGHKPWAIQYTSRNLWGCRDLLEVVAGKDGFPAMLYARVLEQDPGSLEFASARLRADPDIVMTAVVQDAFAFRHATEELRRDSYFVVAALEKVVAVQKDLERYYFGDYFSRLYDVDMSWRVLLCEEEDEQLRLPPNVRADIVGGNLELCRRVARIMPWLYLYEYDASEVIDKFPLTGSSDDCRGTREMFGLGQGFDNDIHVDGIEDPRHQSQQSSAQVEDARGDDLQVGVVQQAGEGELRQNIDQEAADAANQRKARITMLQRLQACGHNSNELRSFFCDLANNPQRALLFTKYNVANGRGSGEQRLEIFMTFLATASQRVTQSTRHMMPLCRQFQSEGLDVDGHSVDEAGRSSCAVLMDEVVDLSLLKELQKERLFNDARVLCGDLNASEAVTEMTKLQQAASKGKTSRRKFVERAEDMADGVVVYAQKNTALQFLQPASQRTRDRLACGQQLQALLSVAVFPDSAAAPDGGVRSGSKISEEEAWKRFDKLIAKGKLCVPGSDVYEEIHGDGVPRVPGLEKMGGQDSSAAPDEGSQDLGAVVDQLLDSYADAAGNLRSQSDGQNFMMEGTQQHSMSLGQQQNQTQLDGEPEVNYAEIRKKLQTFAGGPLEVDCDLLPQEARHGRSFLAAARAGRCGRFLRTRAELEAWPKDSRIGPLTSLIVCKLTAEKAKDLCAVEVLYLRTAAQREFAREPGCSDAIFTRLSPDATDVRDQKLLNVEACTCKAITVKKNSAEIEQHVLAQPLHPKGIESEGGWSCVMSDFYSAIEQYTPLPGSRVKDHLPRETFSDSPHTNAQLLVTDAGAGVKLFGDELIFAERAHRIRRARQLGFLAPDGFEFVCADESTPDARISTKMDCYLCLPLILPSFRVAARVTFWPKPHSKPLPRDRKCNCKRTCTRKEWGAGVGCGGGSGSGCGGPISVPANGASQSYSTSPTAGVTLMLRSPRLWRTPPAWLRLRLALKCQLQVLGTSSALAGGSARATA